MAQVPAPLDAAADPALHEAVERVRASVARVIVGQGYLLDRLLLIALLTGGHILIEGVPGLAKTLPVRRSPRRFGATSSASSSRPTCSRPTSSARRSTTRTTASSRPRKGPIFANIVLADEINRAPAKVQAALLEAMQEQQVTIGGTTYPLAEPFLVLATQNPIEQEGTYPLPEAQVDRFMMKLRVGYPTRGEEKEILRRMAGGESISVGYVASPEELLDARRRIAELYMDERIVDYIVELVARDAVSGRRRRSRSQAAHRVRRESACDISLAQASRAHAFLRGRAFVTPDDVKSIAPDVLRHRVLTSFEADAEA